MSGDFHADAREFREAGAALRAAGDKAVNREFSRALREVAAPFGRFVLVAGAKELPRRGGLAYRVAGARVSVQVSPLRAGITVRGHALRPIDRGELRHPVFARSDRKPHWVKQDVPRGVFSRPFHDHAGQVQAAMLAAGQRVLDQIKQEAR